MSMNCPACLVAKPAPVEIPEVEIPEPGRAWTYVDGEPPLQSPCAGCARLRTMTAVGWVWRRRDRQLVALCGTCAAA